MSLRKFAVLLAEGQSNFENRCFSATELKVSAEAPNRTAFLAGRFAAKEAVSKALGTGFTSRISPLDIEILQLDYGAPYAVLGGGAAAAAQELGISEWLLSISHSEESAIASAIAL